MNRACSAGFVSYPRLGFAHKLKKAWRARVEPFLEGKIPTLWPMKGLAGLRQYPPRLSAKGPMIARDPSLKGRVEPGSENKAPAMKGLASAEAPF